MFTKCSNPDCRLPFNHREGRLLRFRKPPLDGEMSTDEQSVEHYWLCKKCSALYEFNYEGEAGMKIKLRVSGMRGGMFFSFVAAT